MPTGDGWSYDPLTMRQDKEKVYGRGTADDKGPALAAFYAMRAVRELGVELSKNCKLILGADEECGSSDIRHYFAGHPVPPKTLSPDADYPVINIEKGGLHADASAEWAEEDVLPRIGWIDAGIKFNVVPAKAKALVLGLAAKDVKPYLANAEKKTRATFDVVDEAEGAVIYAQGVNAHASTPYEGVNALTALNTLLAALPLLERKIRGYAAPDALLTAVESRSSSPVRIHRDEMYQCNIRGLYPCGEGAGYAGGILSAAADGMRCAEQMIKELLP